MESPSGPAGPAREFGRLAGTLALAAAVAAFSLLALDAVPGLVSGEPRGILRVRDVDTAERLLGARLLLPTFFPDKVRWPPEAVRVSTAAPRAAAVEFTDPARRWTRLVVCQTVMPAQACPGGLLDEGREWYSTPVTIGGQPATLDSVRVGTEGNFDQVVVRPRGRFVLLRYDGPADELVRMATTLRETRP